MNASKHGTNELPGQGGDDKICFNCVSRTQHEQHTFMLLQDTSAMAAIVNIMNINCDAAGWLFERSTPPSMVQINFLGVEQLTKICLKCVRRIQLELQTFLLLQYTSAMAAIVNLWNKW